MIETGGQARSDRMLHIDRAKGLGIALVVYGHLVKSGTYGEQLWYALSKNSIYDFHMPLFMYLSGFVFFISGAPEKFYGNARQYLAKRFDRLMIPFLAFGCIVILGKFLASHFMRVDDGVSNVSAAVWDVIANRPDNPSISIWYLFVLFVYVVVTPLLWRASGRRVSLLLGLGALLWLVPWPEAFYVRRIAHFFLFFSVGGYVALNLDRVLGLFRRYWIAATALFAIGLYLAYGSGYALLICGLLSIPALHGLMLQPIWDHDRLWLTIGINSMAIYLMNTIFIGVAKAVYAPLLPHRGGWFAIFVLVLFAAGMIGPMLVKYLADRWKMPFRHYLA